MKRSILFLVAVCAAVSTFAQQNYLWAQKVGGSGTEIGYGITTDAAGNVYTVGTFMGTCDFDPGPATENYTSLGAEDIFVTKYDANGLYQWTFKIGGSAGEIINTIRVNASGDIFIAGGFRGTVDFNPSATTNNLVSTGGIDMFIAKYSSTGTYQWAKAISGSLDNYALSFDIDAASNMYVTGQFRGTVDFDPGSGALNLIAVGGNPDMFVAKYTSAGNALWAFQVGSSDYDSGNFLRCTPSGMFYVTGYVNQVVDFDPLAGPASYTCIGGTDAYIAKYTTNGNLMWMKAIAGTADQFGRSIDLDAQSNPVVSGNFRMTTDFDPGAGVVNRTATASTDGFILRLDSNGTFQHVIHIAGNGDEDVTSISVDDATGTVHATGSFVNTADFDPGAGTLNLISTSVTYDAFKASYDNAGNVLQAFKIGSGGQDYGRNIVVNAQGDCFITGNFNGTADFDPSGASANLTSSQDDAFIAKYGICTAPSVPSLTAVSSAICAGSSTNITASGQLNSAAIWEWHTDSCGGASVGSGTTITVSPTTTTTYYVRGEGGCIGNSGSCGMITITVNPVPVVSITGNLNLCPDETTTLSANGAMTYSWSTGSTATNVVLGTADAGSIIVTGTDTSGCVSGDTVVLTATLIDTSVTLNFATLTATQSGATYQWVDCANGYAPVAGETAQSFTPAVNGMYACILNLSGCPDTSMCYAMLSTEVSSSNQQTSISLMPNPASTSLVISDLHGQNTIAILSSDGKKVLEQYIASASCSVDVSGLPAGMYVVLVQENTETTSLRFIKE